MSTRENIRLIARTPLQEAFQIGYQWVKTTNKIKTLNSLKMHLPNDFSIPSAK